MEKSRKVNANTFKRRCESECPITTTIKRGRVKNDPLTYYNKIKAKPVHNDKSNFNSSQENNAKFSANDRLKNYRKLVQTKINQPCKVHTLEDLSPSSNVKSTLPKEGTRFQCPTADSAKNFKFSNVTINPFAAFKGDVKKHFSHTETSTSQRTFKLDTPITTLSSSSNFEKEVTKKKCASASSVQNRLQKYKHKFEEPVCQKQTGNFIASTDRVSMFNGVDVWSNEVVEHTNEKFTKNSQIFAEQSELSLDMDVDMEMEWSPIDEQDAVLNVSSVKWHLYTLLTFYFI